MDTVLAFFDEKLFTPYVYPTWLPEDHALRQFVSLNIVTNLGGVMLYLLTATLSYVFLFDKNLLKHPLILENQIARELKYALTCLPIVGVMTCGCFLVEVRGWSKLYDSVSDSKYGWWTIVASVIAFILFTDCFIYWIHRFMHNKLVYKYVHKPHHLWKVPTPFASHAFHPIDGFLQSCPYHIYVFLFPMHKYTYLALYVVVNIWTVSIHDNDFRVPQCLKSIINGCAHHTDHHLYYNYNYGQYFTLWDRIGGSFKDPTSYSGNGPKDLIYNKKGIANGNDFTQTMDDVRQSTDTKKIS